MCSLRSSSLRAGVCFLLSGTISLPFFIPSLKSVGERALDRAHGRLIGPRGVLRYPDYFVKNSSRNCDGFTLHGSGVLRYPNYFVKTHHCTPTLRASLKSIVPCGRPCALAIVLGWGLCNPLLRLLQLIQVRQVRQKSTY